MLPVPIIIKKNKRRKEGRTISVTETARPASDILFVIINAGGQWINVGKGFSGLAFNAGYFYQNVLFPFYIHSR